MGRKTGVEDLFSAPAIALKFFIFIFVNFEMFLGQFSGGVVASNQKLC